MLAAAAEVLRPLVGMLLANGVKHAPIAELVKRLLVEAALERVPGATETRAVSRVSVSTGIHRKEVKRLLGAPATTTDLGGRSLASEAFTRWLTDRRFLDDEGRPMTLPRASGGDPALVSFEMLAREVSRDVHARTILEELLRLKMIELDDDDRVRLVAEAFVPAAEERQMMRFLADNVGDHLAAAIANVEGRDDRFLEQAIFADELSAASAARIELAAREHWQRTVRAFVPMIQALVDDDRATGRRAAQRIRVGMFSYSARMSDAADDIGRREAAARAAGAAGDAADLTRLTGDATIDDQARDRAGDDASDRDDDASDRDDDADAADGPDAAGR